MSSTLRLLLPIFTSVAFLNPAAVVALAIERPAHQSAEDPELPDNEDHSSSSFLSECEEGEVEKLHVCPLTLFVLREAPAESLAHSQAVPRAANHPLIYIFQTLLI